MAAQNGHHAIIEALLNLAVVGALGPRRVLTLFQVQNSMGNPLLHQVAETGDRAILSVIFNRDVCIALGRDVFLNLLQVEDRQGRTLLQAAVQNSRRDVFQAVLVTDGIDLVDRAAFVRLLTNAMATAYRVGNREDCQFFITQIRDLALAQRISQWEMTDILAQLDWSSWFQSWSLAF